MDMDDQLRTIFPQIETHHCLEIISDSEFYIYDSEEGRCFIKRDETRSTDDIQLFKVINQDNQGIRFLAVDECLFLDDDQLKLLKRCDCLLYNETCFCFIELKKTKGKQKGEKKRNAIKQLKSTIQIFKEKFKEKTIDFKHRLEAYACVSELPTRPAALSSTKGKGSI